MTRRRFEDRLPSILYVSDGDQGLQHALLSLTPRGKGGAADSEEVILVWPAAAERTVAFEGRARLLEDGQEVPERAEGLAAEWHRDQMRLRRRAEAGERFVVFSEQVTRARTAEEIVESLIEHAAAIVGGYRADVLSESVLPLSGPTLFKKADGEEQDAFSNVLSLCAAADAQAASLAPMGEGMTLVVLERRAYHSYEPQHWYLLRAIATQATTALQRLAVTG